LGKENAKGRQLGVEKTERLKSTCIGAVVGAVCGAIIGGIGGFVTDATLSGPNMLGFGPALLVFFGAFDMGQLGAVVGLVVGFVRAKVPLSIVVGLILAFVKIMWQVCSARSAGISVMDYPTILVTQIVGLAAVGVVVSIVIRRFQTPRLFGPLNSDR
jgi:hypothetical protein